MSYSIDLRERAVSYVHGGGLKSEASRLFGISRPTLYRWLSSDNLLPRPASPRQGKLDKSKLAAHVRAYPDALLRERAAAFAVSPSGIWRALRKMHIRKKND